MSQNITSIWVYLAQTPLLWLAMTLAVYQVAYQIYRRMRFAPIFNPVLIAVVLLVALLTITGTPYQRYFDGAQFVHFLLGPATVSLAIPLYSSYGTLRRRLGPVAGALLVGSLTGVLSAGLIGRALGLAPQTLLSMLPKSVTTPIAMGISEQLGGLPSLTAVLVILTGIVGSIVGPRALDLLRVEDDSVRGFALGIASHGIGTARSLQISEEAGAFAGLAMGLNGAVTTLLAPLLVWLVRG
ncbi:MAG: LrgB family protein [Kouleothrix sp.]|nr:LrgB family protein [Kouleothrix sp.]